MDNYYQSRYIPNSSRRVVWQEIVNYLKNFIKPDSAVLDLGAGYCDFINTVKAKIKYAVDISSESARHADSDVKTFTCRAWELTSISNASLDVIHASNLFEHLIEEELSRTINEIKRVLKDGGILILLQPNFRHTVKNYFDDPTHKTIFTDEGLKNFLLYHGFEVILRKNKFLPFSIASKPKFLPISTLLVRTYLNFPWKPFAGQMLFVAKKK